MRVTLRNLLKRGEPLFDDAGNGGVRMPDARSDLAVEDRKPKE